MDHEVQLFVTATPAPAEFSSVSGAIIHPAHGVLSRLQRMLRLPCVTCQYTSTCLLHFVAPCFRSVFDMLGITDVFRRGVPFESRADQQDRCADLRVVQN